MFIVQRTIGVSIYCILLLISFFLLYSSKSYKKCKRVLVSYLIALSIMAWFFVPNTGNDLYRINDLMHIYSTESLNDFYNRIINSSTPVALVFYRYIGKIGIDNFLPLITNMICYYNIFYIIYDYSSKNKISRQSISLCIFSTMCTSTYMLTIANIRTMLAFSIIAKCFYDEIFNKKSIIKNIGFYILASLIHSTAVIIILLRMSVYLLDFDKKQNSIISVIKKAFIIIILLVLIFLGRNIIMSASDKANGYITSGVYNYFWENVITWMYVIFLIRTATVNSVKKFLNDNKDYKRMILLLLLIILVFNFEHSIFTRFTSFAQIIFIPIIMERCEKLVKSEKKMNYKFIFYYLLVILVISCIRGNLCSLKFWI